jgi:hypothetical protein
VDAGWVDRADGVLRADGCGASEATMFLGGVEVGEVREARVLGVFDPS